MSTTSLTVMFADLDRTTAFPAGCGDEAWRQIKVVHGRMVRAASEAHDAIDLAVTRHGHLATFGSPLQALAAAATIQRVLVAAVALPPDRALRPRIGLHAGDVSRRELPYLVGAALHVASRISGKAAGGQVFLSQAVRDAAGDGAFADRGLFWLKGFPERWRLYEMLWGGAPSGQAAARCPRPGRPGRRNGPRDRL